MPDVVMALVLEHPPAYPHQPGPGTERSPYARFALIKELAASGLPVNAIAGRLLERNPRGNPEALRRRAAVIAQLDPEVLQDPGGGRRAMNTDTDVLLRQVQCPALLLRADPLRGGVMSLAHEDRMVTALPSLRVERFGEVGHESCGRRQGPTPTQ